MSPLSFLIVDTYYPGFLETFYARRGDTGSWSYAETLESLLDDCFGTADFYSRNLRALGHRAIDVIANDEALQAKWAAEQGSDAGRRSPLNAALRRIPYVRRHVPETDWLLPILMEQIRAEKPDILYMQNLSLCEPDFVAEAKQHVRLVVGQIASAMPHERLLWGCDLILTSFPHYVDRFRRMGIPSQYFGIGFESTLLDKVARLPERYGAVFVGGITEFHVAGNAALERLAAEVDLDVWGYGIESQPPGSTVARHYHGEAWGLDMYNVFNSAKIVINRHGEVAEQYANNMRLYEATGVGSLLITDEKDNLDDLFAVGSEVVTYHDADDLVDKVKYYLTHEDERARIAHAGQVRTLRDHTYRKRMQELEVILEPYLADR